MKEKNMKINSTPGPWKYRKVNLPFLGYEIIANKKLGIARMPFINEIDTANACLIAAAPDLLAACKAAVARLAVLEQGSNLVSMLDQAILKAEGGE